MRCCLAEKGFDKSEKLNAVLVMAGIPLVADSDAMSGIEPLGTISESSAGASPAQDERTISARSSANTAELLASTLLPLGQLSDTEVSPQFDTARLMGSLAGGEEDEKARRNLMWQNEDGQTVSSIFSPLSEKPVFDGNSKSLASSDRSTSQPSTINKSLPQGTKQTHLAVQCDGRVSNSVERDRGLPASLLTPRKLESFQQNSQRSKSLNTIRGESFVGRASEADGANPIVQGRRRDFVCSFDRSEDIELRQGGTNLARVRGHVESEHEMLMSHRDDFSKDRSPLTDYDGHRLSADSTLTEHLLRGITPMMEDTSPYSLPFDSGLASNIQSLQGGMQSHVASFQSESYILQEALEKEKYRRKHCELQIKELQSKLLENQQLLAVAEATRRKKDSMIAQVEKNFSKIMSDWKSKDKEKLETLDRLKRECEKHEHIARMREQELEVREKENRELRLSQETLQSELNQVKDESSSHVEDMKQQMALSIQQMEHAVEERVAAEQHVKKVQDMLAKERSQWREKEVALTKSLARVEEEFDLKQKELKGTLESEAAAVRNAITESNERKEKITRLNDQLAKTRQEKESLSLELNLKQAQFEASLQRQEMDWKEQMERLILERMELLQEETSHQLEKQREAHHAQIAEMAERQGEELRRLREESSKEMKKKEVRYQSSIDQFQAKLDLSHQEVLKLSSKLEQAQGHRSTIINKLQHCLQSYTSDSLMMLGELGSSPAASSANQFHSSVASDHTPNTNQMVTDQSLTGHPRVQQQIRTSVEQPLLQLMNSLNTDAGYQTLSSSSDRGGGGGVQVSHTEGNGNTTDKGNLSFMAMSSIVSQPMESEVYNQPLPMRYEMASSGSQPLSLRYHSTSLNMQPHDVRYGSSSLPMQPHDVRHGSTSPSMQPHDVRHGSSSLSLQHPGVRHGSTSPSMQPPDVRYGSSSLSMQPPGVRYSSTGEPTLPPLTGSHTTRHIPSGMPSSTISERYHSADGVPNNGQVVRPSGFSEDGKLPQEVTDDLKTSSGARDMKTSKLYHFERPENDTSVRSAPQYGGLKVSRMKDYEEGQDHFAPVPESDDLSISEHPLDNTNQSLGNITSRLGREEDRRHLLQHYLKELLNQTSVPEQLGSESPEHGESTHYKSRDIHKARFSTRASKVSSTRSQASHGTSNQHPNNSQNMRHHHDVPPVSAPTNTPVQRDVVPVKDRVIVPKQTSGKSGQRSGEESRSGRRSAEDSRSGRSSGNSSVLQGRVDSSNEQTSTFGTSTPKKKGHQPTKPPTRKSKSSKNKPAGVWR
ncbi:uncharacterized protein [Apostichopus japonicus]|uniref:uncharacterized protein isoform X2 n=1 Tax=Stichopus japonicus TaxID=307972 RepID=UPI003AB614D3